MRILGLDVGDVRTGVSISDPLRIIASPLTILNSKEVNVKEEIIKIVESRGVKEIIYGLPISLDGSEKRQAEKVREFIYGMPYQDWKNKYQKEATKEQLEKRKNL